MTPTSASCEYRCVSTRRDAFRASRNSRARNCSDFIFIAEEEVDSISSVVSQGDIVRFNQDTNSASCWVAKSLALSNPSDVTDEDVGDASIIVGFDGVMATSVDFDDVLLKLSSRNDAIVGGDTSSFPSRSNSFARSFVFVAAAYFANFS